MNVQPFDITCYNHLHNRFQNLFDEELINRICYFGRLRSFEAEQMIMDIGDEIAYFPLIVSGSVKILTEDDEGKELLLYYLEMGDTCAVTLNIVSKGNKSKIRAVAEDKCEILFLPVDKVDEWMVTYKSWRAFIMETYSYRMSEMLEAIDNLAFHNMEERLLKYLRDKVMVTGSQEIHATHAHIANELHSSRVVISRMLAKLEKDGLITHSRNKVQLLKL
ncbi:MAG: Crp/Fnr family transcriptional regulator [Bacteroidia bacterium]